MHVTEQILQTKLGDALVATHSYYDTPSGGQQTENNCETAIVIAEETSLDQLKTLADLTQLPQIISADLFPFLLEIDPVLNAQISGAALPRAEETARFATHALYASAELRNPIKNSGLQKLADSFDQTGAPTAQFVGILEALEQSVESLTLPKRDDAPAELPELRAFYEEIDMAILVMPDAAAVGQVDWENVAGVFGRKFSTLLITTTSLLPYLARYDLAVPFAIDRFRHTWGANPIPAYDVPLTNLLRNAAQMIFKLGTVAFPHALICTPEPAFGTLIHNIQNQLLKTQFQYELLTMVYEMPLMSAPRLSAERSLPDRQRIANIQQHIAAWLALYQEILQTVASEEISPP